MELIKYEVLDQVDKITNTIEQDLNSPLTFAAYNEAIGDFIDYTINSINPFENPYQAFVSYKNHLRDLKPATANKKLSAIRRFFKVAAAYGYVSFAQYDAVAHTENIPNDTQPFRSWLTEDEARALLYAPDTSTEIGRRDQVAILFMLVLWFRRAEIPRITWGQLVQQDGMWLIVNVQTKRNKVRHAKVPDKYVEMILNYRPRGSDDEPILAGYSPQGIRLQGGISEKTVYNIVAKYGELLGIDVAPHKLRRTGSTLAYYNGAGVDQIRQGLGHNDERTTRIYLQDAIYLENNATDFVDL